MSRRGDWPGNAAASFSHFGGLKGHASHIPLANVWLRYVELPDRGLPEMYPPGTTRAAPADIPTRSPLPLSALTPVQKVLGQKPKLGGPAILS
jgi:hypothetical protein